MTGSLFKLHPLTIPPYPEMKSFIIFTLISATLASQVVEYTGNQNSQLVPITPDGKHYHATINKKRGVDEVDITWAPNKLQARSVFKGDLDGLGTVYREVRTSIYDEGGVRGEIVQQVARNLGLDFEAVHDRVEDKSGPNVAPSIEEID